MNSMNDLLSASSLLMAIAAILFSLWYAEITEALEIKPDQFNENNAAAYKTVTSIFWSKAFPVALMSLLVTIIFLPDAVKLAVESLKTYQEYGIKAIKKYDAVKTAYCFVTILSAVLAIYMLALTVQLRKLLKELNPYISAAYK